MKITELKNKKQFHLLLIVLIAYFCTNFVTGWFYYQDYCRSIDVIAQMVASTEQEKIDAAADILKNRSLQSASEGKRILREYGYLENGGNELYERFIYQCALTTIIIFCIFSFIFVLLLRWRASVIREEKALLCNMEEVITNFRDNNFEVTLQIEEHGEQEKIRYQLEVLGNYLKLLKEEARLEKEGTKELVSDISHQLKTPVAALDTCFTVLLQENLSEEEREEFQTRCRNALDGLEILLQSLLQISKMEAVLFRLKRKKPYYWIP